MLPYTLFSPPPIPSLFAGLFDLFSIPFIFPSIIVINIIVNFGGRIGIKWRGRFLERYVGKVERDRVEKRAHLIRIN